MIQMLRYTTFYLLRINKLDCFCLMALNKIGYFCLVPLNKICSLYSLPLNKYPKQGLDFNRVGVLYDSVFMSIR